MPDPLRLALDRGTARRFDADGRMHVAVSNISKSNICEYFGHEIPDGETLGLSPDRKYRLWRHPDELAKAAPSFNNIPLLDMHVPVSAEAHQPDRVVGSTGTDAVFEPPYLRNSLVIWAQGAIDAVEAGEARELSCAYRYVADMTFGSINGEQYDGIMRSIEGNHLALVPAGRAGPDVIVGDSMPAPFFHKDILNMTISRTAQAAHGALAVYLKPKLAADAKVDYAAALRGVTAKNWKAGKPEVLARVKAVTAGKLAKDADIADAIEVLDRLDDIVDEMKDQDTAAGAAAVAPDAEGGSLAEKVLALLEGKISPEDMASVRAMLTPAAADAEKDDGKKDDDKKDEKKMPFAKDGVTMAAMDAAIASVRAESATAIAAARAEAETSTMARLTAIRAAEDAVSPFVGRLALSMDSAGDVYRYAFKTLGVDHADVPEAAFPAMLKLIPRPGQQASAALMASDAATEDAFAKRFPHANRLV